MEVIPKCVPIQVEDNNNNITDGDDDPRIQIRREASE